MLMVVTMLHGCLQPSWQHSGRVTVPKILILLSATLPLSLKAYNCASAQPREKYTKEREQNNLQWVYKVLLHLGVLHYMPWYVS
jgi:hypothetical protein